jgi:glycosyltransferase involved in cell wall biosynthesis
MLPKISIITCVYGAEAYLHKCLDSLINQTYKNLEFVIIDDGSPDKCPEICDAYAAKDPRITLIHQKNAGYGVARNVGLQAASGEYVGFVDPDDWIDLNMMSGLATAVDEQAADIVICDWQTFNDNDEQHGKPHHQKINNEESFEKLRDEFLLDKHPNFLCNKIFAKKLFAGLVIPPDIVLGDLFVGAEVFARSHKLYYVPQAYYCYRVHASFASTRAKTRRKYGMFMAWREHERVCEKYQIQGPLSYSRLRAQQAAISLLSLDKAQPYLTVEQEADVQGYLRASAKHRSPELSAKHRIQWWFLEHAPSCSWVFGKLSVMADDFKQKQKFGK